MRAGPVPVTVTPHPRGQSQTSAEARGQELPFIHIILRRSLSPSVAGSVAFVWFTELWNDGCSLSRPSCSGRAMDLSCPFLSAC